MRRFAELHLGVALWVLVVCTGCPVALSGSGTPTGAPKPSIGEGPRVATIGSTILTVGDLETRINAQSPFVRARFDTEERKREFVETQVRFEVLAQEAFRRGMHEDSDVQESLKKILVQKLTRQEFDGRVSLQDITDGEMQAYYEAHQAEYNKPEMMRVSMILIPFGDDDAAAKTQAEAVQRQAAAPATLDDRNHFKALVEAHSKDDTTRRTGGDLRYLTAEEVETRLGAAAKVALFSSTTLNEVLPVVRNDSGYVILKRTGRRKPVERGFEQVKNQLRNVLYREKRTAAFEQYVEELKSALGVQVVDEAIAQIRVIAPAPGEMPAVPGHGHAHAEPTPATPPGGATGEPL